MVRIKLDGGLGNQLFQYAFIKSVGHYFKVAYEVDVSVYSELPERASFELHKLNIPSHVFCPQQRFFHHINFLRILRFAGIQNLGRLYVETKPVFKPVREYNKHGYYYGYFQFFRYFDSIADELSVEFQYKDVYKSPFIASIRHTQSVGVHFRRGDYISKRNTARLMSDISKAYYIRSAKLINSHSPAGLVFFIFSNDLEWAKENAVPLFQDFGAVKLVDHSGEDDPALMDFECLKQCKHQIIANSTFSWWAAYLNKNAGKKVCAPRSWYRQLPIETENFYPQNWNVVESNNE